LYVCGRAPRFLHSTRAIAGCLLRSTGVGLEGVDSAAMGDLAAYENVGAEAGMNESAQHTWAGEAFEVFTWFAETAPQAFHLADPEALADELAECEAADDEVAAGGGAIDT